MTDETVVIIKPTDPAAEEIQAEEIAEKPLWEREEWLRLTRDMATALTEITRLTQESSETRASLASIQDRIRDLTDQTIQAQSTADLAVDVAVLESNPTPENPPPSEESATIVEETPVVESLPESDVEESQEPTNSRRKRFSLV